MKYCFRTLVFTITIAVLISMGTAIDVRGQENSQQYRDTLDEIVILREDVFDFYKEYYNADDLDDLVNNKLLFGVGTFATDWIVYCTSIIYPDEIKNDEYKIGLIAKISEDYQNNLLSSNLPMDYYRISLVLSSLGEDPSNILDLEGQEQFDLIDLSILKNEKTLSMINSLSWGLLVLDSINYDILENADFTREDLIEDILILQKENKGFALVGDNSDPDITAMVITALSPYYGDENVKQVIDEALLYLSKVQLDTGDFKSWGNKNSQTGAQVIIALSNLGIDPLLDERFIKGNNTLLDGLLAYKLEDNSFANTYPANKTDNKATEQALMAILSLEKFYSDSNGIFDFKIEDIQEPTEKLTEESTQEPIEDLDKNITTQFIAVIVVIVAIVIVQIYKKRLNQKGEKQ